MTKLYKFEEINRYNERSLKILARALIYSAGEFSIVIVSCNDAGSGKPIIQYLRELHSLEIYCLSLDESADTLYTTIVEYLKHNTIQPQALAVFGLETLSKIEIVLSSANIVRDEFLKNLPFPIILWVNEEILPKILKIAPDFKSFASVPIKL